LNSSFLLDRLLAVTRVFAESLWRVVIALPWPIPLLKWRQNSTASVVVGKNEEKLASITLRDEVSNFYPIHVEVRS
jgi:hypothetical protein